MLNVDRKPIDWRGVADILSADVVLLEHQLQERDEELFIAKEMLSSLLDITHQAVFRIYTTAKRAQS